MARKTQAIQATVPAIPENPKRAATMAIRKNKTAAPNITGTWAPLEAAHTPKEAAEDLDWDGPEAPGEWQPVVRRFRDWP